jgi:hypothetical protein
MVATFFANNPEIKTYAQNISFRCVDYEKEK